MPFSDNFEIAKCICFNVGRFEAPQVKNVDSKSMIAKPMIPQFKFDDIKTWTRASSQNLSSVLNDPRRHGRQSYLFTQLWGEGFVPQDVVPLTLLPIIPKVYFDGYVKRMEFVSLPIIPFVAVVACLAFYFFVYISGCSTEHSMYLAPKIFNIL